MPPIIVGAVVALAYIGMGAAGMVAWTTAIIMAVVSIASAAASYALQGKAKAPGFSSLDGARMVTSRDSIRARELIYGRMRKGGMLAWIGAWDNKNWIALVIVMAGHEVADIEEVYFNDELAFKADGTPTGRYVPGRYGNIVALEKRLGSADQAPSHLLTNTFPEVWTNTHLLRGIAYMVVALHWEPTLFRAIPNITAIIKGKKVYDPRTDTTAWSTNPALCLADYLAERTYGLGASYTTDISEDDLIAAANVCDEQVAIPGNNTEARYHCNGILSSSETPQVNIEMLLSSMAGQLVYSGGQWVLYAGAYDAPTVTFGDDDFRGNLQVQTRQQRRDLCNAVRGIFVNPERGWQITDFPPVTSAVFQAEDNDEQLWRDVELPFTTTATAAQRLAKIELFAGREQISVTVPVSLKALQVRAGETVALTHARFGWTAKPFRVLDWSFSSAQDQQGVPVLGCRLDLRETSSAVYDITADEYQLIRESPQTSLPNPFDIPPPGTPTKTEEAYISRDGAGVKTVVHYAWLASPDAMIIDYQLEAQYLGPDTADADYLVIGTTPYLTLDLWDARPGVYSVRVKAISNLGIASAYATTPRVEIYGLLDPPDTITGLSISILGGMAILRWDQHPDLDVRMGGLITFRHSNDPVAPDWGESVSIGDAVPGGLTVAVLPLKPGSYLVKAKDSSGIIATTAAWIPTDGATIFAFAAVDQIDEDPGYAGDKTAVVVVDDILKLDAIGDVDDWTSVDAVTVWDSESGLALSGTYDFSAGFDFATKHRIRLRSEITAAVVNALSLFDSQGGQIDDWQNFDGTTVSDADCQVWARTTDDDPDAAPTWGEWNRIDSAEVYCRAVDLQARLSTTDNAYNIEVEHLTVYADELA